MADIQRLRFHEPLPTVEHEIQEDQSTGADNPLRTAKHETPDDQSDGQSIEADEPPPIKRLDGEVTRLGDMPFAGGMYCEVWVGRWVKSANNGSGEGIGGEEVRGKGVSEGKVDVEKVSPVSLTAFSLLI